MQNIDEFTITQAVLAAMADCKNERFRTVMTSLVQHLHAFARDVHLTATLMAAAPHQARRGRTGPGLLIRDADEIGRAHV